MPHELTNLLSSSSGPAHQDHSTTSALVAAKFCSFGMVASVKWFTSYVVIFEGQVRLYDDEQSFRSSPESCVLKIHLTRNHQASEIKLKSYSQNSQGTVDLHCFYVQIDNGVFFPTKELKIGCVSRAVAEALTRAVDSNARA